MIQKILDKIIKFINWPYGVGGKQYIIREKLFKLASISDSSISNEKIKFKDTSGMIHSLIFTWRDCFCDGEKCIIVCHDIHVRDVYYYLPTMKITESTLEIFKISKEEDCFSLDEVHPVFSFIGDSEYEKYEKYGLFHRDTYIDYDELAKRFDLLMIKLL